MSGKIFISYRREESSASAARLYDRLHSHFPSNRIFIDVDNIAPGVAFVKAIEKTVGECDVLIAVIGAHWLTSTDEQNGRRLDNPEDFVRREIATALKRDIRVIPVLVDGALMPRSSELPDDLKPLVRRNALRVSDTGFDDDCRRLVAAIEQVLAERRQREEKERLEAERREIEAKEHLDAKRQQKEEKELLERKPHSPPPGPGAPSTSPSKIKLRPVAGIMALLALVIGLLVGAAVYFGSQRPESKPTTPKAAVQPSSPVAVVTPSTDVLVTQGRALIATPSTSDTPTPKAEATASATAADTPMNFDTRNDSDKLPTFFPPRATDSVVLPFQFASKKWTLQKVAEHLDEALRNAGYWGKCSHYWLEDRHGPGFAIVTHIEHIQPDGKPVLDQRWGFDLPRYGQLTLASMLKALLNADPGHYRLLALVVCKEPLVEKETPMTTEQVQKLNAGPKWFADSPLKTVVSTEDFHLIAYVYEFERKSRSDDPTLMVSSNLTAEQHLRSTALYDDIEEYLSK